MQCTVDSTSVPTKQPADAAVAERIRTLAAHVCRNGPQFEAMVRTKEADNETFSFLNGGDGAAFYQWTLFCMLKGYSPDDVERTIQLFRERIEKCHPGSIDLTAEDKTYLYEMLRSNTGSKDNIASIRRWAMKRAHSIVAVGLIFESFARSVCSRSVDSDADFHRVLHLVYVINDIFFNSKNASTAGPYTTVVPVAREVNVIAALLPRVTAVMNFAYHFCRCDTERENLLRVVSLWLSKKFLDSASCNQLKRDMTLPYCSKLDVTAPLLEPPFAIDLPAKQKYFVPAAGLHPADTPADLAKHLVGVRGTTTPMDVGQAVLCVDNMSVGSMATLSQAGLKAGFPAYSMLNVKALDPSLVASFVEPGRLDARLSEYFRKVNEI